MVGEGGFEPPKSLTTDLQSAPFGHSGTLPYISGAGGRTRTPDLLITNQLLYQLSYTSTFSCLVIIAYHAIFVNSFFTSVPIGFLIKGVLPAVIVAAIPRLTIKLDCAGIAKIIRFTNMILTFYMALCVNHVFKFYLLNFTEIVLDYSAEFVYNKNRSVTAEHISARGAAG